MTIEFELNVLRFLLDRTNGRTYLKKFSQNIEKDVFSIASHQLVYGLLKDYFKNYNTVPDQASLIEYFDRQAQKQRISKELSDSIVDDIKECCKPLDADTKMIKDTLIRFAQTKMTKDLIKDAAPRMKEIYDEDVFGDLQKSMRSIVGLTQLETSNHSEGLFLDNIQKRTKIKMPVAMPSKFHGMNARMMGRGFSAPQVVVVMSGPKFGKTMLMVNIAMGYVRDGYNVLYLDTENGEARINRMCAQNMMGCTAEELDDDDFQKTIPEIAKKYKAMKGNMKVEFMSPKRNSCDDVEAILDRLEEEENFVPQIIVCDYFDNMLPVNKRVVDKRLGLQEVYMDWKVVAEKRNFCVFTPSQVGRKAVQKDTFSMDDISEDFGKVANCDSLWAFCASEEELNNDLRRLVVVANRDGLDWGSVRLKVDYDRVSIEELAPERHRPGKKL